MYHKRERINPTADKRLCNIEILDIVLERVKEKEMKDQGKKERISEERWNGEVHKNEKSLKRKWEKQ